MSEKGYKSQSCQSENEIKSETIFGAQSHRALEVIIQQHLEFPMSVTRKYNIL